MSINQLKNCKSESSDLNSKKKSYMNKLITKKIRVIVTNPRLGKTILYPGEYKFNSKKFQYVLPLNMVSFAYYNRIIDSDWDDIPEYFRVINLRILCQERLRNMINQEKYSKSVLSILPKNQYFEI
tara:strand:- start:150 stop:527 length:378 start_codon:yes stop_codon:yes gene_type:complete